MNRNLQPPPSVSDRFLAAAFCAMIFLPLIGSFIDLDPASEMGTLHFPEDPPRLEASWSSWRTLPARFEAFFDDRFGFRRSLVRGDRLLKYRIFGVAANPSVVVAENGWFYFKDAAENHRALPPLSTAKLEEWRIQFEERRVWLKERGIRYLVVFVPDKTSMYPEHVPDAYRPRAPISRLDQLVDHLEERSDLTVVDLREALAPRRDSMVLYPRTDTHWTDLGANLAAQEISEALEEWYPAIGNAELTMQEGTRWTLGGDLVELLGVEAFLTEIMPVLDLMPAQATLVDDLADRYPWYLVCPVYETGRPALPDAVLFRDSFGIRLVPFLAERFRRIVTPWFVAPTLFDPSLIEAEQPDVVIDQFVERHLGRTDHPRPNHPWVTAYEERFTESEPRLPSLDAAPPEIVGGMLVERVPGAIRFRTGERGASLVLEELRYRPGERILVRIELNSPGATTIRAFIRPSAGEFDADDLAIMRSLNEGANVLYLNLVPSTDRGRVHVDLGPQKGDFVLRDFSVRSASGP